MSKSPVTRSAQEAMEAIRSGQRIFVHGSACTPHILLEALAARASELKEVRWCAISTQGDMPLVRPEVCASFPIDALFVSTNIRQALNQGHGSYIPIFLSEIGQLFRSGRLPLDHALIQVSPPDAHGYCSLGPSVDVARAALESAAKVTALVNPHMPRTWGDGIVHVSAIDQMVWGEQELPTLDYSARAEARDTQLAEHVAGLIPDGATLQLGIGCIPNAVCLALRHHKDLGIHTEMMSDGLLPLIASGVVSNANKRKHPGKSVAAFAMGTRKLYDFLDDNPGVALLEASYVNDTGVIRQNPKVAAVNSAMALDLMGQAAAEALGPNQYSGVGGQMDFLRGASLSHEGKPILAMRSTTTDGRSKISVCLPQGSPVTTTRAHMHYVVTEFGTVDLFGLSVEERAQALIGLAHPNHRDALANDWERWMRTGKAD